MADTMDAVQDTGDQGGSGSGTGSGDEHDALLSRLRVIEDQPLEARAAAFSQVHDALQRVLDGGGSGGSEQGARG